MKTLRVPVAHVFEALTIFDLVDKAAHLEMFALEEVGVCHVATSFRSCRPPHTSSVLLESNCYS